MQVHRRIFQKGMSFMDPRQTIRQINKFNKTAFDNSYSAVSIMQEQAEKVVDVCIDKIPMMTEEGKKMIKGWREAYRQGREQFKKAVDEHFEKMDSFLNNNDSGTAKHKGK
jgi:hypothetical protein